MRRRIVGNVLSLGVLQGVSYILPLVSIPYFARVLGEDRLGVLAAALALMQLLVVFTDYGFNLSASREASIQRDSPTALARLFATVTTLRLGFMLLGAGALLLLLDIVPLLQANRAVFLASYLGVVGNALLPLWLFQGVERLRVVSIVQIVSKVLMLGAILLCIKTPEDVALAALLQAGSGFVSALLILPFLPSVLGPARIRLPEMRDLAAELRAGWYLFLSTFAINLYTTGSTFVLGLVAAPRVVAFYHVAEKLVRAVQFLFNPISQAVYPHVAALAKSDRAAALAFNRGLIRWGGSAALLASMVLFISADIIVKSLFGESFGDAVAIVRVMSPLPFIIVLSNVFGIQTMLPFGLNKEFGSVLVVASVVHFSVFVPCAWVWGGLGAAWTNLLVETLVTATMFLVLRRNGLNPVCEAIR